MTEWRAAISIVAVALGLAGTAAGAGTATRADISDLPKSASKIFDLTAGTTYQASLFLPHVRFTVPVAGWQGSQHVSHGYDWFFLGWRDRGGMAVISAPGSAQSLATTVHRLETDRADTPATGISIRPAVAVTVARFPGQQFDGTVTGQYGHTFAPFSSNTGGASASAGDHWRLPKDDAFRIIVLNVRGMPIVFVMDSDQPTLDTGFVAAAAKLLKSLRFPPK